MAITPNGTPTMALRNNVTTGTSGGDQNMVVAMAGPPDDQRLAEAPAPGSGDNNIQFALLNNVFGPSLQDNANVSIRITYYDDPNLAGAQIGLNAYQSYVNGIATIVGGPPAPYNARAVLQGTGKWVDAYFYLPNVDFYRGQSRTAIRVSFGNQSRRLDQSGHWGCLCLAHPI